MNFWVAVYSGVPPRFSGTVSCSLPGFQKEEDCTV